MLDTVKFRVVNFKAQKDHDEILPNDLASRIKYNFKQTAQLPKYIKDGLKGDKDANFYELMKIGNLPYWIGGPMIVAVFAGGGKEAGPIAKQKAAGVALYYVGAMLAKTMIDSPVKFFKGIDLNRKYEKVVPLLGGGNKKEIHDLYESIDFTRWDLLYNQNPDMVSKDPTKINGEYKAILNSMGVDKEVNDPDSTVKPYVKKIIVASRAWKSAMLVPLAGLALGLSTWEGWKNWGNGLSNNLKEALSHKKDEPFLRQTFMKAKGVARSLAQPLVIDPARSVKHLWKNGIGTSSSMRHAGKFLILLPLATAGAAILNILNLTYLTEDTYIDGSKTGKTKNKWI